jgi:hypothetical protein
MSLQHNDFNEQMSICVGSPVTARRMMQAANRRAVAEFRASDLDTLLSVNLSRPGFLNRVPVDPVQHPAGLCQSVRAFSATEAQLSRISAAMGLTFWGEAVALVLGYVAAFPEIFTVADLKGTAPAGLLKAKGSIKRGTVLAAPCVRGIQAPLTEKTALFLARVAAAQRISRADAGSLILHRHIGRVLALIVGAAS